MQFFSWDYSLSIIFLLRLTVEIKVQPRIEYWQFEKYALLEERIRPLWDRRPCHNTEIKTKRYRTQREFLPTFAHRGPSIQGKDFSGEFLSPYFSLREIRIVSSVRARALFDPRPRRNYPTKFKTGARTLSGGIVETAGRLLPRACRPNGTFKRNGREEGGRREEGRLTKFPSSLGMDLG